MHVGTSSTFQCIQLHKGVKLSRLLAKKNCDPLCSRLSDIMLYSLYPPVYCELVRFKFRNWPSLTVSSFGRCCQRHCETSIFLSHRTVVLLYILFSQSVFAHTTSAISYCLYLTATFQPTLFNKLDHLFLMTVQLQILSEAISFVCIFYKKILFT